MKILKEGRPQEGWSIEKTCTGGGNGGGGCGAKLLVEEDDLFGTESHHYDGSSEYYTTFRCAGCGVLTDLSRSDHSPSRRSLPSYRAWCKRHGIEYKP